MIVKKIKTKKRLVTRTITDNRPCSVLYKRAERGQKPSLETARLASVFEVDIKYHLIEE
jgi:hypothetical protein